jgi:hypothetical protein
LALSYTIVIIPGMHRVLTMPTTTKKAKKKAPSIFPLALRHDLLVSSATELVDVIERDSVDQVRAKRLAKKDDRLEFLLGCVALLFHRIRMRLVEEAGDTPAVAAVMAEVKRELVERLQIDQDEFDMSLTATRDRPRMPYGFTPLSLALVRARKKPIRLTHPAVAESKIATLIAGMSWYVQQSEGEGKAFYLPVDEVRQLLGLRKLVVGGAITALIDAKVLKFVDETFHTGKARTFRFWGEEGGDFEFVKSDTNE